MVIPIVVIVKILKPSSLRTPHPDSAEFKKERYGRGELRIS